LNGATQRAQKMHSTVEPFYCGYDPTVQLNQCLDAVKSGRFDAFLIDANDGVGITPCVTSAAQHGIAVVAVDLPIGADPAAVGPQVPGQAGAVLTPAAKFGGTLAPTVAALCDKIGKCNVVYLAGSFVINYDIIAMNDLNALPSTHPNIKLVAEEEALYDQGTARTIMQNLLAQSTDIQLVVAGGDQMARGAEEAIAAAGPLPNPIAIIGGGAGAYAVDAIRAGRWYGTFVTLPFDEGDLGAKMVIRAARYQHLTATGIDPVVSRGFPAFLTADNLADFKGFVPEWPG
jgi:ribose transport system substrate-binding protein